MGNHSSRPTRSQSLPKSENANSSPRVKLSAKLRNKLDALADRRISPSSINFPEDAPEFHGGYATVSRALLVVPPHHEDVTGTSDDTEEEDGCANGRTGQSTTIWVATSGGDSDAENKKEKNQGLNIWVKQRSKAMDLAMKLRGREGLRPCAVLDESDSGSSNPTYEAVAVKKMKISGNISRVLGLTLREAGFLVDLSHPNIVTLRGFVEDVSNNMIWLVFPWEENGSLRDFVASADWTVPERIWLICDVIKGVRYLHSRKPPICHGDLKSINVLVSSDYRAVITDFGSARRLSSKDVKIGSKQTRKTLLDGLKFNVKFCASTNTMTLTGDKYTLRWAAPELLTGDQPGLSSDIWALGWLGSEVMTGSIPFENVGDGTVVARVITGDLPSMSRDARMLLIQSLSSLLAKCWNLDPTKRPTAEDCRFAISWMPMIIPKRAGTADRTDLAVASPKLHQKLGDMYGLQNDYSNAADHYTKALDMCTELGDRRGRASALFGLATVHRVRNEYREAVTLYSESLKIWTEIDDRNGRASTLLGLATLHRLRSEYSEAITLYSEYLQIWTEIGDRNRGANGLLGLAEVHRLRNEYSEAVPLYLEYLQIRTELRDRNGRADALFGLAGVHRRRGEFSEAITLYSEDLQIRTEIGDRNGRADALFGLAEVHRRRGEHSEAVTLYSECLQIRTEIGDRNGRADALSGLATMHRLRNEYSEAVTLYSECLQIWTDIGHRKGRASTLRGLGNVHRSQKKYSQALAFFSEALTISTHLGDKYGRAFTLQCMASTLHDQDDLSSAIHHNEQAAEIYKQIGITNAEAVVLKRAAKIRRLLQQREA